MPAADNTAAAHSTRYVAAHRDCTPVVAVAAAVVAAHRLLAVPPQTPAPVLGVADSMAVDPLRPPANSMWGQLVAMLTEDGDCCLGYLDCLGYTEGRCCSPWL